MKYLEQAGEKLFYDFVFYETDAKAKEMYIYCPNCGRTHTVEITKSHNVKWIKENYKPCDCFNYCCVQPKYKRTCYDHENLFRFGAFAEFSNYNGTAALNVYRVCAHFGKSNYDSFGYAFKRFPVFNCEKVIRITFNADGVKYETNLYYPMFATNAHIGAWKEVKTWHRSSFSFTVIEESLKELKGTSLEKYVRFIRDFQNVLENKNNMKNDYFCEPIVMFLIQMHISEAVRRLWDAGYYTLVYNRVIGKIAVNPGPYYYNLYNFSSQPFVNWRGKTLKKILRCDPSKADLISPRDTLTAKQLEGINFLEKNDISVNSKNVSIATRTIFNSLNTLFAKTGFPLPKLFKYIRNQASRENADLGHIVGDYYDYLDTLKKLQTSYTADVVFPTRLKIAHDNVARIWQNIQAELRQKRHTEEALRANSAFSIAVGQWIRSEYKNDKYSISPVKDAVQLVNEAGKMHNCSAGYIDRIISKQCVIFIIREVAYPDKAFCMLELELSGFNIVQNRGVSNVPAPKEVKAFAAEWLKNIVMPLIREKKISA